MGGKSDGLDCDCEVLKVCYELEEKSKRRSSDQCLEDENLVKGSARCRAANHLPA